MSIIKRRQPLLGYSQEIQRMLAEYRLRNIVDYIQYNNPKYVYTKMSQELDIPLSSVIRYVEKLRKPNIRFRADFNIRDLDLKLVMIRFKGKKLTKHDIEKLPHRHWIAAAINGLHRSSIIMYRIPLIMDEKEIIEQTILKLGAGQNFEYSSTLKISMLSKPSFTYYMMHIPVDPIRAVEVNDGHPIVSDYINYKKLIEQKPRTSLSIVKDKVDIFGLAIAEYNVLELEEKLGSYFKSFRKSKKIIKAVNTHINHIVSLIRGNRMIALSRNNMKLIIVGKGREPCLDRLGQRMLTYLYSYSIAINRDTGEYAITFDVPPGEGSGVTQAYISTIIDYVNSLCSNSIIDTIVYMSKDVIEYYTIPFQNYDFIAKTWIVDNRVLERYVNKWREKGLIYYLL